MDKRIKLLVFLLVIVALILTLDFFVITMVNPNFINRDNIKITGESILDNSSAGIIGGGISFNNTIKIEDSDSGSGGGGGGSSSENQGNIDDNPILEQEQTGQTNILVYPLDINTPVYGLAISGNVFLAQKDSLIRAILIDSNGKEYLAYESYYLIADSSYFSVSKACEETCFLDGITPSYLKIQLINSNFNISSVDYSDSSEKKSSMIANSLSTMNLIEDLKIEKMNENLADEGMIWVAGETSVSSMSYEDKKKLFGVEVGEELPNLQGFDYYSGGIFEMSSSAESISSVKTSSSNDGYSRGGIKIAGRGGVENISNSNLADSWDWRNVNGANNPNMSDGRPNPYYNGSNGWNTDVKCQAGCFINLTLNCSIAITESQCISLGGLWKTSAACTAFSAAAATELMVNLYYNQHINIDISEQESISYNCARGSYVSSCERDYEDVKIVINDYASRGAISEDCFLYFKYGNGSIPPSSNNINTINYTRDKCTNPDFTLFIKRADQFLFDTETQSDKNHLVTLDQLKQILIENGSVAVNDINSLNHAMALIGYGKVKNGTIIYTHPYLNNSSYDLIVDNDSRINKTFWIFKNSFGDSWGESGYIRMVASSDVNLSSFSVKSVIPIQIISFQNRNDNISVNDVDGDGYCNWGISPQPLFNINYTFYNTTECKKNAGVYLEDCDDSNNSLGGFDSGYNCMLIDRIAPYFITIPANVNINYTQGFGVQFNATDETAFGNYVLNWTTLFAINQSGYLKNSTILPAGIYNINVTINDTTNNINSTIYQVIVNKADSQTSLTFDKTSPQEYGAVIIPICSLSTGVGTTSLTNGTSGVAETLGAGSWNLNCSYAGNANYSTSSNFSTFVINKNSSYVPGISGTTPLTYETITNVSGSNCPPQLICSLNFANGIYGVGSKTFNYSTSGNANYSANSITKEIIINQASSLVYTYLNNSRINFTIQKGTSIWLNGSRQVGEGNISLYNDGILINNGANLGNLTLFSNVGLYNITSIYLNTQNYSTSFETFWLNVICTQNLTNTSWTSWSNQSVCNPTDLQLQNRSKVQYDSNNCGGYTNITLWDYNNNSCNYCSYNLNNTAPTEWQNLSCSGTQMNQTRSWIQYDLNRAICYDVTGLVSDRYDNITQYESQLVGPTLQNTTRTDWVNISCLFGDIMNQSRFLTQYDIFGCAQNTTLFEYQSVEICDFCTPNLVNTSWSGWQNLSCSGTQRNQSRFKIQYDSNSCGEISNQTFYESQLVGPTLQNTTWSNWLNLTCSNSQINQSRFLTQYDIYSCGTNLTIFEYRVISPPTEVCNGIDDNCDGIIDNGLTTPSQSCSVGVGACQRTGTQYKTCNGASGWSNWGTCSATPGTPTTETCNNIDDDCDGSVDEELTTPSGCSQTGYCSGAVKTCSAGVWGECSKLPKTETCNNIDDNCDGSTDESWQNYAERSSYKNSNQNGVCSGSLKQCSSGSWIDWYSASNIPFYESPEAINSDGKDNNCNGQVDESLNFFPNFIIASGKTAFHLMYFKFGESSCSAMPCSSVGYECYTGSIDTGAYGFGTQTGAWCYKECIGCNSLAGANIDAGFSLSTGVTLCNGNDQFELFYINARSSGGIFYAAKKIGTCSSGAGVSALTTSTFNVDYSTSGSFR